MTEQTQNGTIALDEAVERLRAGGVIAFPTETVFGLGADATNPAAVERVYVIKDRPRRQPMPVIVADLAMADAVTDGLIGRARRLAEAFWPGPLTLVCPASAAIDGIVTAGGDTVALRAPGLPLLCELIRELGRPIIAPSANRAGGEPARSIEDLRIIFAQELSTGELACFLPTNPPPDSMTPGREPSTIVVPGDQPGGDEVLRAGPITAEDLLRVH